MSWELTRHACRYCGGRVLADEDGGYYRCADCCASADEAHELCACGTPAIGKTRLVCAPTRASRPGLPEVAIDVVSAV